MFHKITGDNRDYFYTWLEGGLFNQTLPALRSAYEKIGGTRISQIRSLSHASFREFDGVELALDQTNYFGKQHIFNETNIKFDVAKLKNQSYVSDFTKQIKIEFIFYSNHLHTYVIVKINLNYFPGKIVQRQVLYVSIL